MSLDLIILILTGDDSMNYLYNHSQLLKQIESCLDSSDTDILTANILAIGNFARTDDHCIELVKSDILKKLINILKNNSSTDADVKLQHALLSSLKNLIMPKQNKQFAIELGLVDIMLNMLENNQLPVVFKLLGTLRMVVDKQGEYISLIIFILLDKNQVYFRSMCRRSTSERKAIEKSSLLECKI